MKTYKEIFENSQVAKMIMEVAQDVAQGKTEKEIKELREMALMMCIAFDEDLKTEMSDRVYDKLNI